MDLSPPPHRRKVPEPWGITSHILYTILFPFSIWFISKFPAPKVPFHLPTRWGFSEFQPYQCVLRAHLECDSICLRKQDFQSPRLHPRLGYCHWLDHCIPPRLPQKKIRPTSSFKSVLPKCAPRVPAEVLCSGMSSGASTCSDTSWLSLRKNRVEP